MAKQSHLGDDPGGAVGFLFLLNGQQGLINGTLGLVGIERPTWSTDPAWIKPGIMLMSPWTLGSTTIIYLAALNNVPRELFEAARVDGASYRQLFRQFGHGGEGQWEIVLAASVIATVPMLVIC
jgi:ABC-type glycerol-3-phosphate transport system permease component